MEDGAAVFKASKRRKVAPKTDKPRSGTASEEETTSVVKAKAPMRTATRGIQFTRTAPKIRNDSPDEQTGLLEVAREAGATPPAGLLSRFVGSGSSNQANVNNDRLMMRYVDQAMAAKNGTAFANDTREWAPDESHGHTEASGDGELDQVPGNGGVTAENSTQKVPEAADPQEPTQTLTEVDLVPDVNVSSKSGSQPASEPRRRKPRPRLGHDGKPITPRPRRGADPEDIARGHLVEQILHEHGLRPQQSSPQSMRAGNDEAADERMAAEFQAHFMDAMAERADRQAKQNQGKDTGSSGGTSQGPRLGGGRSARAKMAAMQQTQRGAGQGPRGSG